MKNKAFLVEYCRTEVSLSHPADYDVNCRPPQREHFCEPTRFRTDCFGESGREQELLGDADVLEMTL
jgi:hypothetical protein